MKKIFISLGNERPQILVRLEDCVLEAIIAISEGKPREETMHNLHSHILSLLKDLKEDDEAMRWFNLHPEESVAESTALAFDFPSTPLASTFIFILLNRFPN